MAGNRRSLARSILDASPIEASTLGYEMNIFDSAPGLDVTGFESLGDNEKAYIREWAEANGLLEACKVVLADEDGTTGFAWSHARDEEGCYYFFSPDGFHLTGELAYEVRGVEFDPPFPVHLCRPLDKTRSYPCIKKSDPPIDS